MNSDDSAHSAVDEANGAVEGARIRVERLEPRLRRFKLALYDLGLTDVVGQGWADIGTDDNSFTFDDLSPQAFDRLVGVLEAVGQRGARPPRPVVGQRGFFPEVAAPAFAGQASSIHPELPR